MPTTCRLSRAGHRIARLLIAVVIPLAIGLSACARNGPPIADFARHAAPTALLAVTFDASASIDPENAIARYLWSFGDGSSGSGRVVTHTYEQTGYYVVELVVFDDRGVSDALSALVDLSEPSGAYPLGSAVGNAALPFVLPNLEGQMVAPADHRGRVVILEFWASWCLPCHDAMAAIKQLAARTEGVHVLAISLDRYEEGLRSFLEGMDVPNVEVLWGSREQADRVKELYGVVEIPHILILDRRGVIRFTDHFREFDSALIDQLLE